MGKAEEPMAVTVEKSASADLMSYGTPDASIEDKIKAAAAAHPAVMFGKQWCPFCLEVRNTFAGLGVPLAVFNLDVMPNGGEVHSALKSLHKQTTVPYVFVNSEFVGGCDTTKELQRAGKLHELLRTAGVEVVQSPFSNISKCGVLDGKARSCGTLLQFPEIVDDRAARFNGIWAFIICLLVAIFYKKVAAHWVMVGLLGDFAVRLAGGGNISPLGSLSNLCVSFMELFGSKPKLIAGPPKQFATLCGVMFSGIAVVFYLCSVYEIKLRIVGLSFTCALGLAAAMEGFLGFCLGCFFFSLAVRFKLVPADVYSVYANVRAETDYTWTEMNKRLKEGVPSEFTKHFDDSYPTQIDYKYKAKTDEQTREDFNIIKHVKITHFIMHLATTGCAVCWQYADNGAVLNAPAVIYYVLGLGSAVWFFIFLVLYACKMVMYPKKVHKEWMCNVQGNSFVLPFIIIVLFAHLIKDKNNAFATVLFWIGAPASLGLSFVRVGDWIAYRKDIEHINPGWMLMPVSNFISALVGPVLNSDYRDAMQFWYAFALMMWCVLFVISFFKAVTNQENDDRRRTMVCIWVAAPAVGAVAYISTYLPGLTYPANVDFNDFIFLNMYWMSLAMAFCLLWAAYRPFLGRIKFDMGYWAAGFPADALALVAMQYHAIKTGTLGAAIAYATLALASCINAVLLMQTAAAIIRLRVFVPDFKWGPLSFMKLVHEAFKEAIPAMLETLKTLENNDSASAFEQFVCQWNMIDMVHDEHAKHEDEAIFKHYNDLFPGVIAPYTAEHEEGHKTLHTINDAIKNISESTKGGKVPREMVSELAPLVRAYAEGMLKHLRSEEDHLQGIPRKHVPIARAKAIICKVWDLTPAETWYKFVPWVIVQLPMLQQRVRFVRTLLWAMPDRAQHIGMMIALGTDAVQWKVLTDEVPEIIPRGASGWNKFF